MAALYPDTKGEKSKYIVEQYRVDNNAVTKSHPIIAPTDSVPPYYVFNFNDNKGYALAAADDRMSPILCIADTGSFYVDSVLTNPGQIIMLSRIETDYKMALGMPIVGSDGSIITSAQYAQLPSLALTQGEDYPSGQWVVTDTEEYDYRDALLSTSWDQEYFFNALMYNANGEKCPAGCVNIAVGQILNFHGQNLSIDGYYVDWSEVNTVKSSDVPGTLTGRTMLQNYLYRAALAMNASMTPDGTGIDPEVIPGFIASMGYSSGGVFADYSYNKIRSDIVQGYPALLGGFTHQYPQYILGILVNTTYSGGHRWVCDRIVETKTTYHWVGTPALPDKYGRSYLVHCNFGWDGLCDGLYSAMYYHIGYPVPDPIVSGLGSSTLESTEEYSGTPGYYQYNLTMVTGIRP